MSTKTAEVSTTNKRDGKSAGSASWMAGFFLLGILLGMPGSLVITWHYHINVEPGSIGLHFLAMSAGFILASISIPRFLEKAPVRTIAIGATGLACGALILLAYVAPPVAAGWRIGALSVAGFAAGALTYALFYANEWMFEYSPASSANRAGALFVGGSLLATIVVGSTYFGESMQWQMGPLALAMAVYGVVLMMNRFRATLEPPQHHREDLVRDTLKDLRSIATVLFSLLIFFQFACEWAMAGWLPLFLIHTLGMSPVTAIWGLGAYFLALMLGRLAAQVLLPIVSHKRMLLVSVAGAMAGYGLLSVADMNALALLAAVIIGFSHAPIYPLIAERLDSRFSYHPGFYNGAISIAITGAMATPWLLGYVAEWLGMRAVMMIPAAASIVVLMLSVLIMLESRLMGSKQDDSPHGLMASEK